MFDERDITRAQFWMRRWKAIGGMFKVDVQGEQIMVELIRRIDPDHPDADAHARASGALEAELERDPHKHKVIAALVKERYVADLPKTLEQLAAALPKVDFLNGVPAALAVPSNDDGPEAA